MLGAGRSESAPTGSIAPRRAGIALCHAGITLCHIRPYDTLTSL